MSKCISDSAFTIFASACINSSVCLVLLTPIMFQLMSKFLIDLFSAIRSQRCTPPLGVILFHCNRRLLRFPQCFTKSPSATDPFSARLLFDKFKSMRGGLARLSASDKLNKLPSDSLFAERLRYVNFHFSPKPSNQLTSFEMASLPMSFLDISSSVKLGDKFCIIADQPFPPRLFDCRFSFSVLRYFIELLSAIAYLRPIK